jgi:MFS transporter, ACS family, tartrate transporter
VTAPPSVILDGLRNEEAPAEAIGRSAMRKATLRLIPLIGLGYGAAYMDRINISFASIRMNQDLHFSATVYGLGAGLFFISYAACEIPSNLLLYRFGARRWLARIMFTWGLLAMAMSLVRTPNQFYLCRFLLGMAEAGFFPGVIFYLTNWFPPELRARTIGRFYISLPLSAAFMGLVAGALLDLDGTLGLAGWQWLFLIEGIPPILLGVAFLIFLADTPAQAKWLTAKEQAWILSRTGNQFAGTEHSHPPLGRVLLNIRVWQVGIFDFLMLASAYGYIFIAPRIIQDATHLSIGKVGLITCAISLLGVPAMLLGAIHSDRAQTRSSGRYWQIIPWCIAFAVCVAISGLFRSASVIVPAMALMYIAYCAMQAPFWSLPTTFFTGRSSAAAIAAINTIGITGGFVGPLYIGHLRDLTGSDRLGMASLSVPMLAAAGIMFYLYRNSQRAIAQDGSAP